MTDTGTPPPGQESGSGWGTPPPGQWGTPPAGQQAGGGSATPSGWSTPPPGGQASWGAPPTGGQPGWGQPPPTWGGGPWGSNTPQAPKPGVVPLRPLGFGELLDGAFTTVQRYPKIMLGLSTAIMGVLVVASLLTFFVGFGDLFSVATPADVRQISDSTWISFAVTMVVLALVSWLGGTMLTGMITVTVGRGVLGQPATVAEVWRASKRRVPRLLGLTFVLGLTFTFGITVLTVIVVVGFVIHVALGVLLAIPAVLGGIFAGVVFYTRTAVAPAALVLETRPADPGFPQGEQQPLGVFAALSRSWELIKGRTPRTFGVLFVANLIASVVASVVQTAFTFLSTGLGAGFGDSFGGAEILTLSLLGIGNLASAVLQVSFLAAVNALVYVDARMRKEGLDIELAQAAANASAGGPGMGTQAGSPWATR
ncbi:proline-rich domain-containing protein [Actinopolymorpha alba]|uniref:proline-rich domain-containing protein n=1 Tax=Actinopolymorpha alba TaxID=533267 RepID=UPI0012F6755F|nr:proline-rich domain-containing protein [Actinopolymorpha alba]